MKKMFILFITLLIFIILIIYYLSNKSKNIIPLSQPTAKEKIPLLNYTVKRNSSLQPIKQFNYLNQDGNEYSVYYYGIEDIYLKDSNANDISLKICIESNYITLDTFINYFENKKNTNEISKDILLDGGSTIYKTNQITIIIYNTLDGNKDIYFAIPELNNYEIGYK